MQFGIRKNLMAVALLGVMTLGGIKITYSPGTCRFLRYYRTIQQTESRVSLVERVLYSLLLAAQPAPRTNPASGNHSLRSTSS
jgi:hypothetical protein